MVKNKELEINEWWQQLPNEKYWLEITGRPDVGADLKAPQFADDGESETYSYSLMKYVRDGDVVFHYLKKKKAIIGFSVIDGSFYEDDIVWKALGSSAAKSGGGAYPRPGWKAGLKNFALFDSPITLSTLRLNAEAIKAARDDLKINVSGSLYFPFSFNKRDELHGAVQGYLVKMPAAIVEKLISNQLVLPEDNRANVIAKDKLGVSYRPADEEVAISKHKPFELDPDVIDRGSQAHRKIQNNVAEFLLKHGIQAESPLSSSVNFDVGWQIGSTYFIAEIKSVTEKNFEKQLRLGLGQILRYLYLAKTHQTQLVKPILIVEFVDDISWYNTCSSVGVELIAADNLHKLLSL